MAIPSSNADALAQSLIDATGGGTGACMGIGLLGDANTSLKRKFRFLFGLDYCNFQKHVSPMFVQTASRPNITIEDTEISFLNEVSWIPGKAKWDTITVTYYDGVNKGTDIRDSGLYSWLASVYDFTNVCRNMGSKPIDYAGRATLVMLDGCGNPMELWVMENMWPTNIKFGEVDYKSSDIAMVELTLRYSNVTYTNFCGQDPSPCTCSQC